jgi:ribosomal protein S27E
MKSILELIADVPTNAVLRLQAQALEKKVAELEKKCAGLESQVSGLQQELAAKMVTADFIEHKGALWKRKPGGGYYDDVLCRECHNPMVSFCKVHPYKCASCGVTVDFTGRELSQVMRGLP